MSFEIARMIVQSYRQSNEQRIKSSMEMAYQEALSAFQSEQEARKAALEILEMEQKAFDSYVKDISKLRRDIIKGETVSAKQRAAIDLKNVRGKAAVARFNAQAKLKDEAARRRTRWESQRAKLQLGQTDANLEREADKYASKLATAFDLYTTPLSNAVVALAQQVKADDSAGIERVFMEQVYPELAKSLEELPRQEKGFKLDKGRLFRNRKADLGYQILDNVVTQMLGAIDEDDPRYQQIKQMIFDRDYPSLNTTSKKRAGVLADVADITQNDINLDFVTEKNAYKENKGSGVNPDLLGDKPLPARTLPKKFIPEEVPEGVDRTSYQDLRDKAAPVFNALRDDFQIDKQEFEQIQEMSPEAMAAYQQLQQIAITDPLAVTQEEQLLLDQIALKRQMNILQQRGQIAGMRPQMRSPEAIKSRAADIAEPAKAQKFDPSQFTPAQQKYFATERQAYDLSEKSDNDIRTMGAPEKFGLSLFNETFDKGRKSYVDGQSYDTVLSRLETQFEGRPEEQLRALAAYNSRAMALQRASNPLVFSDGQKNTDYLAALKAIAPKVK